MESTDKVEPEVVEPIDIEKETEWFLSSVDAQTRITIDRNIRVLYNINHKDMLWVKLRKTKKV